MLLWVLVILVVVVLAVLAYAAMQPDGFTTRRSITINAPADKVFPLINDVRAMNTWNPYATMDPSIAITYSGPPTGRGASYAWQSKKVGSGSLTVTGVNPLANVTAALVMTAPWKADNVVSFDLMPAGTATEVSWSMSGKKNFMSKLMGLFMDMDDMVGKSFSSGLATLKGLAER